MKFGYLSILIAWFLTGPAHGGPSVEVRRGQEYVMRDSGPLAMDIYMPHGSGPFPGVLVVHGGAWTVGNRSQLAPVANALAERGYVAATISYRLAPTHKFPAQLDDCRAAVRWLREHSSELKLDGTRMGGFGYSAGGQLVALLGTLDDREHREAGVRDDAPSARLQAVVAGGAPCDFRVLAADSNRLAYWLGGTRAAKPDAYRIASPAAFISSDDPPMFFFHGERDLLVPARSPQRMVALLAQAGVTAEMRVIKNAGHLEALLDRASMDQALAFADKHLRQSAASDGSAVRENKHDDQKAQARLDNPKRRAEESAASNVDAKIGVGDAQ